MVGNRPTWKLTLRTLYLKLGNFTVGVPLAQGPGGQRSWLQAVDGGGDRLYPADVQTCAGRAGQCRFRPLALSPPDAMCRRSFHSSTTQRQFSTIFSHNFCTDPTSMLPTRRMRCCWSSGASFCVICCQFIHRLVCLSTLVSWLGIGIHQLLVLDIVKFLKIVLIWFWLRPCVMFF